MSLENIRALLRTYTPGRRVRFEPESQAVRDKAPPGVESGVIIQILLLPLPPPVFGLEIEIEGPDGPDGIVLGTADVMPDPLDLDTLQHELRHRTVRFARSIGIGIVFPVGASEDGLIEHVRYRRAEDGYQSDLIISLRIAVDPLANPGGINTFYTDADFTQCRLLRRTASR